MHYRSINSKGFDSISVFHRNETILRYLNRKVLYFPIFISFQFSIFQVKKEKFLLIYNLPAEPLRTELFLALTSFSEFFSSTELPFRVLAIEPDRIDPVRSDFSTFLTIAILFPRLIKSSGDK